MKNILISFVNYIHTKLTGVDHEELVLDLIEIELKILEESGRLVDDKDYTAEFSNVLGQHFDKKSAIY